MNQSFFRPNYIFNNNAYVLDFRAQKFSLIFFNVRVVRKSSETDSIKFKISSKTSRGKKDSTKDTIIDITSDSQVNSNFPNRWSQASLTFNNYFYLFLYLYIT